jgi:malate dehydrogenase (quinone)
MSSDKWQDKIKQMIPSYGQPLDENPDLNQEVLLQTSKILHLEQDLLEVRSGKESVELPEPPMLASQA